MPSPYTQDGWLSTTATVLVGLLPEQTFTSALAYATTYLADVGGWVPDDMGSPTGFGHPSNNQVPADAANSILADQLALVYEVSATLPLQLDLNFIAKLPGGLNQAAVLAAIQTAVQTWMTNLLTNSGLPLKIHGGSFGTLTGTLLGSGSPTASERVTIHSEVTGGGVLTD